MNTVKKTNIFAVLVWVLCGTILAFTATISLKIAVVAFFSGCIGYVLNSDWKE